MSFELTEHQLDELDKIIEWLIDNDVAILSGFAGTGKTTLIIELIRRLSCGDVNVVLLGPTGKSVSVMKEKTNLHASTIHSAIYGAPLVDAETGDPIFKCVGSFCGPDDIIIIDEASMIGEKLWGDILKSTAPDAKIILVGDPAQLSPVRDNVIIDFTAPTAFLTEVHRQKDGNKILDYATHIREGKESDFYRSHNFNECVGLGKMKISNVSMWASVDTKNRVVLFFTNKERNMINDNVRCLLKLDGVVSVGEKIIVKANCSEKGVVNGDIFFVEHVSRSKYCGIDSITIKTTTGLYLQCIVETIGMSQGDFWRFKMKNSIDKRGSDDSDRAVLISYAYAITVHSSQGAQFKNVGFVWGKSFISARKRSPDDMRRLLYTAVTRASETLTMFA